MDLSPGSWTEPRMRRAGRITVSEPSFMDRSILQGSDLRPQPSDLRLPTSDFRPRAFRLWAFGFRPQPPDFGPRGSNPKTKIETLRSEGRGLRSASYANALASA